MNKWTQITSKGLWLSQLRQWSPNTCLRASLNRIAKDATATIPNLLKYVLSALKKKCYYHGRCTFSVCWLRRKQRPELMFTRALTRTVHWMKRLVRNLISFSQQFWKALSDLETEIQKGGSTGSKKQSQDITQVWMKSQSGPQTTMPIRKRFLNEIVFYHHNSTYTLLKKTEIWISALSINMFRFKDTVQ